MKNKILLGLLVAMIIIVGIAFTSLNKEALLGRLPKDKSSKPHFNPENITLQIAKYPTCYDYSFGSQYGTSENWDIDPIETLFSNVNYDGIVEGFMTQIMSALLTEEILTDTLEQLLAANNIGPSLGTITDLSVRYDPPNEENIKYFWEETSTTHDPVDEAGFFSNGKLRIIYTAPITAVIDTEILSEIYRFEIVIGQLEIYSVPVMSLYGIYDFKDSSFLGRSNVFAANTKNNLAFNENLIRIIREDRPSINAYIDIGSINSVENIEIQILNDAIEGLDNHFGLYDWDMTIALSPTSFRAHSPGFGEEGIGIEIDNYESTYRDLHTNAAQLKTILYNRAKLLNLPFSYANKDLLKVIYLKVRNQNDFRILEKICDYSSSKMKTTNPNPLSPPVLPTVPYVRNGIIYNN